MKNKKFRLEDRIGFYVGDSSKEDGRGLITGIIIEDDEFEDSGEKWYVKPAYEEETSYGMTVDTGYDELLIARKIV